MLWECLHTDMYSTLVLSYNSISAVYDMSSFNGSNTSVYACYHLHMPSMLHWTGRDGRPLATSRLVSVSWQISGQTENTETMAESHSWRPESWLGWSVIGLMVMSVPVTPIKSPMQECLGQDGMSQHIVAGVYGQCWARVELSGGSYPCKAGLWEAGRVDVKRNQLFLSNCTHMKTLIL